MLRDKPRPAFSLTPHLKDRLPGMVVTLVEGSVQKILALDKLNQTYASIAANRDCLTFLGQALAELKVSYDLPEEDRQLVPRSGPLVVVANHPFGLVEPMILARLLREVRPDIKLLANYLLRLVPELDDLLFHVDPFESGGAVQANVGALRKVIRWLEQGGVVAVFPAGEVAHLKLRQRAIVDPEWSPMVARLVRRTGVPVMPAYFGGANSRMFQMAGLVHPRLRTIMLPRELANKTGKNISVRFGRPIPFSTLKPLGSAREMTAYLRLRTFLLGRPWPQARPGPDLARPEGGPESSPLAPARPASLIRAEVEALPAGQTLVEHGQFQVFYFEASQAPDLLQEIGRLRELTFRQVGEGTGQAVDLDRFDDEYLHLVLWDTKAGETAGAYRLGRADRLSARLGPAGLYCHSLFKFSRRFLARINPGLELGRSFIRQEYQRSFAALMLLWKAIGQYVVQNPDYRFLFGPVSISNRYHPLSRQLMVRFLTARHFWPELAGLVKPRQPLRLKPAKGLDLEALARGAADVESLSGLIAGLEPDGEGVPVLLRQYLKLGGRLVGFNLDPAFADALDGLIVIDLLLCERRPLDRYMGRDAAEAYLAHQGRATGRA